MTAKLTGITWDHPRGLGGLVEASRAWSRLVPEVEVTWSARSLQAFGDAALEPLAAEYDLLVVDHPHMPQAAATGCLLPLDGRGHDEELVRLAGQSVGPSHQSYRYGNHQLALAIDAAAQVAVYRPDLVNDPPTTWDAVLELARHPRIGRSALRAPGARASGRVLWPAKPIDAFSSFCTLAASRATPVAAGLAGSGAQSPFIAREDGLAVLELLHHLAEAVPAWCLDANPIQVADALASSADACYSPLGFGYVNYSRPGFRARRLAYLDMPSGPRGLAGSCLGGAGIAVSASTQRIEEAVAFAYWSAGSTCQAGPYYWGGGQPANAVAWQDEAINGDSMGFFRSTWMTLQGAWVRPQHPGWVTLQTQAADLVHQALRHELDDDEALARMEGSWDKLKEQGPTVVERSAEQQARVVPLRQSTTRGSLTPRPPRSQR